MWGLLIEEDSTLEKAAKVATCAWALWGNRNEVRWGGKRRSELALIRKAVQYLEEHQCMYAKASTDIVGPSTRVDIQGECGWSSFFRLKGSGS